MRYALAVLLCLVAGLLDAAAWDAGTKASLPYLHGCFVGRFFLLAVAWLLLVALLQRWSRDGFLSLVWAQVLASLLLFFVVVLGCMGSYPLWFLVPVPFLVLLLRLAWVRRRLLPGMARRVALDVVVFGVTMLVGWYLSASLSVPFLYGLASRIETHGGGAKLVAWAEERIASGPRPGGPDPGVFAAAAVGAGVNAVGPNPVAAAFALMVGTQPMPNGEELDPDAVPDFVGEMFGRREGGRFGVRVTGGPDGMVVITNGSPYEYFEANVSPALAGRPSGVEGVVLEPGIRLRVMTPPK
jgi:hypothetical protein